MPWHSNAPERASPAEPTATRSGSDSFSRESRAADPSSGGTVKPGIGGDVPEPLPTSHTPMKTTRMRLPERQLAVLEAASATDERTIDEIAAETGLKPETVTGAAFDLRDEGGLLRRRDRRRDARPHRRGSTVRRRRTPETRLYRAGLALDADESAVSMGQVIGEADLDGPEVDIALSNFARKGFGSIDSGELRVDPDADPDADSEAAALAALADGETPDAADAVLEQLDSRGLVDHGESVTRSVTLTDDGVDALMMGIEATETVAQVTPELLASGEWRDVEFSEYNVEADAPTTRGGRKHVLRRTADRVKDVLVGMGFQEMEGPHADSDFWINDCLFMPQDHPARTHWDRFALDVDPMEDIPDELIRRVESAHRDGWGTDGDGYHSPWSEEFAREIALRGHTTSLSMRYLSGIAGAELEPHSGTSPSRRCTATIRSTRRTSSSSSRSRGG